MKLPGSIAGYTAAILLVTVSSVVCEALRPHLNPVNMVMVYLLAVVLAATRLGLKPAILTAFLSVLAFDFLFIPPRFSFRVSDSEYLVTFFGLFVVGVVISSLVTRIKTNSDLIRQQEALTGSLYHLTRELATAIDISGITAALQRAVQRNLALRTLVLVTADDTLHEASGDSAMLTTEANDIARWVVRSGRNAGAGTAAFADNGFHYVPLTASGKVHGVLILEEQGSLLAGQQRMIEAFAGQTAMALERVALGRQAEEARVIRQKDLLERALLNSISHDLRTPLVTITGVLDSLMDESCHFDISKRKQLLATAADEAGRLNRFVGSLLDMTRLEAGALAPALAPCEVEEIIGCAISAVEQRLGTHPLQTDIGEMLPAVQADIVLMTQALVNLLDNAIKYSPESSKILITARHEADWVIIAIHDQGPGIPPGEEERIFDKFYRLMVPEQGGGTGLGLSIVKGIVDAHNGTVKACNRHGGGLTVEVHIPQAAGISPEGSNT